LLDGALLGDELLRGNSCHAIYANNTPPSPL
jgi:hypothetical protein